MDLEAVEMALRAALQQAGAAGLSQLLRQESPAEPQVPCSCGGQSRYKGMRSKPLLTVLGRAEMRRAYYWCCRCQQGQFSTDAALDVENTELSPGVRRMLTLVGSECSSFARGREQMKLLAGLKVTTKAVERTTESIGADIARREQDTIQQALQRLPRVRPSVASFTHPPLQFFAHHRHTRAIHLHIHHRDRLAHRDRQLSL